jgi:hypothetical protein
MGLNRVDIVSREHVSLFSTKYGPKIMTDSVTNPDEITQNWLCHVLKVKGSIFFS